MPNRDTIRIEKWSDKEIASILGNREYLRHFSEFITRKLRRELQTERVQEPRYTHTLDGMELTALLFLQSAISSSINLEREALFHEAAILLEHLASLRSQDELAQENSPELLSQRQILSACAYYLAGYEANSVVMANLLLKKEETRHQSLIAEVVALLLSKRLIELRSFLAEHTFNLPNEHKVISQIGTGEMIFGDAVYLASVGSFLHAISSCLHWIRDSSTLS